MFCLLLLVVSPVELEPRKDFDVFCFCQLQFDIICRVVQNSNSLHVLVVHEVLQYGD
jgi:hypothetical protein